MLGDREAAQQDKTVNNSLNSAQELELLGRQVELECIVATLKRDGDLLVAGVPGSGRRTLVRWAAQKVGATVLEVDCIRATDGKRFIQILCESLEPTFCSAIAHPPVQKWLTGSAAEFFCISPTESGKQQLRPLRTLNRKHLRQAFEVLLNLPQILAEALEKRVVLVLQSFPHIRSWDRNGDWENFLRDGIKRQTQVSYVLVTTIAEINTPTDAAERLDLVQLAPLSDSALAAWVVTVLHEKKVDFDPLEQGLKTFLEAVRGHFGDALTLALRLQSMHPESGLISKEQVEQAIQSLLRDLSVVFESLLLLLPASQVQLLECLSLDPTSKPHSPSYAEKHGLARGGTLQGALIGLQQKGLIYGSEQGYRLALPLMDLWLRQRLA